MKVVGIIGAGASGLAVARHAADSADVEPLVWEQSEKLGGTWRLSDAVDVDKNGLPVHSSMYQNLKCDLPKLIMSFPDHPFPDEGEDFVHHTVVLKYLESYAEKYDLLPYIKFGHHVEKVSPVFKEENQPPAWEVTVKSLKDGTVTTTVVDALCICNGHFSMPDMPDISNIEDFKGRKLHSHDYREPSSFSGLRVLLLGLGTSSLDISQEISSVAEEVYLSHRFPVLFPSEMPPNIHQVPSVRRAVRDGFMLENGETVNVDAIIYCTGYHYSFPFLSESCGIKVENKVVKPLYKHIINAHYPSMGFVGIPSRVIVFPLVHYQAQYFLSTVTGKTELPSTAKMELASQEALENLQSNGMREKEYHLLHKDQFDYMEDLALCSGVEPPPSFRKRIFGIVITRFFLSFPLLKTYSYKLDADGNIIESRNGQVLNTGRELMVLGIKQLARLLWRDFFRVSWLLGSVFLKSVTKLFRRD